MNATSPSPPDPVSPGLPAAGPPGVTSPRPGLSVLARTWLWGWAAIAQFLSGLLLAGFYLTLLAFLIAGVSSIPALGVGIPLTALCLVVAMGLGAFERLRVEAFTGVHIRRPSRPQRVDQPAWKRYLLDARPWRASAHLMLTSLWSLLVGSVTLALSSVSLALATLPLYASALPNDRLSLPFGSGLDAAWWLVAVGWSGLAVVPLVARGLVTVDVDLARWLLGPSRTEQVAALSQRVQTLTLTREATVDSVELERRRIERDLHDGPQQRLVAIAMDLGMAKAKLDRDPVGARELIERAHSSAKEAITEMRQVARGIHPPVLTDRGLDAALSALAARSPVPVTVRVDVRPRPQPTVEAIAYFCVSEALTNVAKHSRASSARVEVTRVDGARGDGTLLVAVSDDGVGGVDPDRGTGLVGLRDRVAAVDGTITVTSPVGGPTVLTVRLPERLNPYRAPAPSAPSDRAGTAPILSHPPRATGSPSAARPPVGPAPASTPPPTSPAKPPHPYPRSSQ